MRLSTVIGACKTLSATIICCSVAGFAAYSMISASTFFKPEGTPTALEASDDPLTNGLKIVETRRDGARATRNENDDPAIILLDDWTYTGKTQSSGYN